jgi:hypothetical protein
MILRLSNATKSKVVLQYAQQVASALVRLTRIFADGKWVAKGGGTAPSRDGVKTARGHRVAAMRAEVKEPLVRENQDWKR